MSQILFWKVVLVHLCLHSSPKGRHRRSSSCIVECVLVDGPSTIKVVPVSGVCLARDVRQARSLPATPRTSVPGNSARVLRRRSLSCISAAAAALVVLSITCELMRESVSDLMGLCISS